METQLNIDRMKQSDCHNAHSLRRYSLENGKTTSNPEDVEEVVVVGGGVKGIVDDKNGPTLCPITPIPHRKNEKSVVVIGTPLSLESPQSSTVEVSSSDETVEGESPRTPEQGVFNPFAPGPERMCLAPLSKKLVKERTRVVARRLDFDHVEYDPLDRDADIEMENVLLETVYETILESILLKQTEEFLAENQGSVLSGCSTPASIVPLTGVSETCPGAPPKAAPRKFMNIDPGLCRKLEF